MNRKITSLLLVNHIIMNSNHMNIIMNSNHMNMNITSNHMITIYDYENHKPGNQ